MWFPADPALLDRVRTGLTSGSYDLEVLIQEIRDDFALFTFCLKGLARQLARENIQPPQGTSPVEILRWAGLDRLRAIFQSDDDAISFHDLRELSDFQAARLKEALVAASAAEALAEHSAIDPAVGYSTALLRQLGLTLIAWNYPALYRRSLSAQGTEGLDEVLSRALGFTPALLGATIMQDWPLSETVQTAVTEPNRQRRTAPPSRLEHICRIGELLARANDPERNPSAPDDWIAARREIQSTLGLHGLELIRARTTTHTRHYADLDIVELHDLSTLDPARRVHLHTGAELLRANVAVKHCPPILARKIRDLYANIVPGKINRANINTLVREIIPSAGFSAGAVYIIDPVEPRLLPRLKIGEPRLRQLVPLSLNRSTDPLLTAFECFAPIQASSTEGLAILAGGLGGEQRAGVLYLEFPEIIGGGQRLLGPFKAIRQALNDCLGLD
jgi:hypothetical protein